MPTWLRWTIAAVVGLGSLGVVFDEYDVDSFQPQQAHDAGYNMGAATRVLFDQWAWAGAGVLLGWFVVAQFAGTRPTWFRQHPWLTAAWCVIVGLMAIGAIAAWQEDRQLDDIRRAMVAAFFAGLWALGLGWAVDQFRTLRRERQTVP